jgi:hypothetical protein
MPYKNHRFIDRAAIFEEIQQNKIDEIRTQLCSNKGFNRKTNKFTSQNLGSSMVNQMSFINSSSKNLHNQNQISTKGGLGFTHLMAAATTAS